MSFVSVDFHALITISLTGLFATNTTVKVCIVWQNYGWLVGLFNYYIYFYLFVLNLWLFSFLWWNKMFYTPKWKYIIAVYVAELSGTLLMYTVKNYDQLVMTTYVLVNCNLLN